MDWVAPSWLHGPEGVIIKESLHHRHQKLEDLLRHFQDVDGSGF